MASSPETDAMRHPLNILLHQAQQLELELGGIAAGSYHVRLAKLAARDCASNIEVFLKEIE